MLAKVLICLLGWICWGSTGWFWFGDGRGGELGVMKVWFGCIEGLYEGGYGCSYAGVDGEYDVRE